MELSREDEGRLLEIANSEPVDSDRRLFARALMSLIGEAKRREECEREQVKIGPEHATAADLN